MKKVLILILLLTQTLTDDTGRQTILTVPATYSMNAHARYFKKHAKNFNEQSANAAACVTIRSIWNHDDLYPYDRRANVRIVEIDSSAPVDKTQAGVKLVKEKKSGRISPFIWRSPANLTKMADFVAKDLMALYPNQAAQIDCNLKSFKQDLFKLRTKYDAKLIDLDSIEAISLTEDFDYLLSELGIEVLDCFSKQQIDWDEADIAALEKSIRENGIKAVICNRAPQGRIFEVIVNNGAQPVILDTLLTADEQHLTAKQRMLGFFSNNLDKIYVGL